MRAVVVAETVRGEEQGRKNAWPVQKGRLGRGTGRIEAGEGHREDTGWGGAQGGFRLGSGTRRI